MKWPSTFEMNKTNMNPRIIFNRHKKETKKRDVRRPVIICVSVLTSKVVKFDDQCVVEPGKIHIGESEKDRKRVALLRLLLV